MHLLLYNVGLAPDVMINLSLKRLGIYIYYICICNTMSEEQKNFHFKIYQKIDCDIIDNRDINESG